MIPFLFFIAPYAVVSLLLIAGGLGLFRMAEQSAEISRPDYEISPNHLEKSRVFVTVEARKDDVASAVNPLTTTPVGGAING